MLKAVLMSLLEFFAESANVFCSQSGNCKSYIMFFPRKFLKTFLGTRRIPFLQSCWNCFAKSLKCCCWESVSDNKNYVFFFQKISSKRSPGQVECLFDNPDEVFLPRCRKLFQSRYKKFLKFLSFQGISPQNVSLDAWKAVMTTLLKLFCQKSQTCYQNYEKKESEYTFSKEKVLLRPLHWTRKMQFGQPY